MQKKVPIFTGGRDTIVDAYGKGHGGWRRKVRNRGRPVEDNDDLHVSLPSTSQKTPHTRPPLTPYRREPWRHLSARPNPYTSRSSPLSLFKIIFASPFSGCHALVIVTPHPLIHMPMRYRPKPKSSNLFVFSGKQICWIADSREGMSYFFN